MRGLATSWVVFSYSLPDALLEACWYAASHDSEPEFCCEFPKNLVFPGGLASEDKDKGNSGSCSSLEVLFPQVWNLPIRVLWLCVTPAAAASCWLLTLVGDLNVSSVSGYVSWNTGCRVPLLGGNVSLTQVADWFTAAAFSAAVASAAAWSRVAFSGLISLGSELAVFVLNCKFVDGTTELWGIMSLQGSHCA